MKVFSNGAPSQVSVSPRTGGIKVALLLLQLASNQINIDRRQSRIVILILVIRWSNPSSLPLLWASLCAAHRATVWCLCPAVQVGRNLGLGLIWKYVSQSARSSTMLGVEALESEDWIMLFLSCVGSTVSMLQINSTCLWREDIAQLSISCWHLLIRRHAANSLWRTSWNQSSNVYYVVVSTRMYCLMFYQFVLVLLIYKYQRQPIGKQTDRQLSVMNIALVHPSMLSYIIYCNTNLLRHGKHDMQW